MAHVRCKACGGAVAPTRRVLRAAFGLAIPEDDSDQDDRFSDATHFNPKPYAYADGGEVKDGRALPARPRYQPPADADEPLGRTMKRDVAIPAGSLPVYQGDSAKAARSSSRVAAAYAEGGEVADDGRGRAPAKAAAKGEEPVEEKTFLRRVYDALPDFLSARSAVDRHADRLKQLDKDTGYARGGEVDEKHARRLADRHASEADIDRRHARHGNRPDPDEDGPEEVLFAKGGKIARAEKHAEDGEAGSDAPFAIRAMRRARLLSRLGGR